MVAPGVFESIGASRGLGVRTVLRLERRNERPENTRSTPHNTGVISRKLPNTQSSKEQLQNRQPHYTRVQRCRYGAVVGRLEVYADLATAYVTQRAGARARSTE